MAANEHDAAGTALTPPPTSAVATVPMQGSSPCRNSVMMSCTPLAGGSGGQKVLCVEANPDYTNGGSGTYAVVSIFPTESCANTSTVMATVAAAPGACVGWPPLPRLLGWPGCPSTAS